MRKLHLVALTGLLLLDLQGRAIAADVPRPILGSDGHPLEVTAEVPTMAAAGLSFAMPGAGQFYLGETTKGYAYLGSALAVGAGIAVLENALWFGGQSYVLPESIAFEAVQGMVLGWLVTGSLSAFDAYHTLASRQPDLADAGSEPR